MIQVGLPQKKAVPGRQAVFAPFRSEPHSLNIGFSTKEEPVSVHCDPFLCVSLIPAMLRGMDLELAGPVSPRLLASIPAIQDLLPGWDKRFRKITVTAPSRPPLGEDTLREVGCFFSAGVDSFHTLLAHFDEIDRLIFVHGFDLPLSDPALHRQVVSRIRDVAARLGKPLIEVVTNVRAFSDSSADWGKDYHGAALCSVALFLAPRFRKVYIASHSCQHLNHWGSDPLLDPLWSTETTEIVHDGYDTVRLAKLAQIVDHEIVQQTLRVCWENSDGAYNCGRCEKCLRTMVGLSLTGNLGKCRTFPGPLDLELVARSKINRHHAAIFLENLEAARQLGTNPALTDALERAWSNHEAASARDAR